MSIRSLLWNDAKGFLPELPKSISVDWNSNGHQTANPQSILYRIGNPTAWKSVRVPLSEREPVNQQSPTERTEHLNRRQIDHCVTMTYSGIRDVGHVSTCNQVMQTAMLFAEDEQRVHKEIDARAKPADQMVNHTPQ